MAKSTGKAAINGYHTISYCWEQSGEVVKKGTDYGNNEYSIADNAKHCIIEGYRLSKNDIFRASGFYWAEEDDDLEDGEKADGREDPQHGYENGYKSDEEDEEQVLTEDNYKGSEHDVSDADNHGERTNYQEYVTWCQPKSKAITRQYITYSQLETGMQGFSS